jgi:hypothetical protein
MVRRVYKLGDRGDSESRVHAPASLRRTPRLHSQNTSCVAILMVRPIGGATVTTSSVPSLLSLRVVRHWPVPRKSPLLPFSSSPFRIRHQKTCPRRHISLARTSASSCRHSSAMSSPSPLSSRPRPPSFPQQQPTSPPFTARLPPPRPFVSPPPPLALVQKPVPPPFSKRLPPSPCPSPP